jgi:hypothetical protein
MSTKEQMQRNVAVLVAGLLVIAIGTVVPQTRAQKPREKQTEFGIGIQVGFGITQYHDTCIMFRVFFISGEFFSKLRRIETRDGPKFAKGYEIYRNFPDELVVDVQADAYPCGATRTLTPALDLGVGLLGSPTFELNWSVGSETQPVKVLSEQVQHHAPGARWNYFLKFETKDIPLTEELLIDVSMRNLQSKIRLSNKLK